MLRLTAGVSMATQHVVHPLTCSALDLVLLILEVSQTLDGKRKSDRFGYGLVSSLEVKYCAESSQLWSKFPTLETYGIHTSIIITVVFIKID